jgi:Fibronectin type III domain
VKILVANVVTRTSLCGFGNLNSTIATYNSALAAAVPGWSTSQSPVRLADISSGYNPATDTYDGLHPDGLGEYEIADAFSTALANDFGVGKVPGPPPASVPGITLTTPTSLSAGISDTGVLLQWSRVDGASGYKIFERDITGNPSPLPAFSELPLPLPGDHWYAGWGSVGHTYQYQVAAARGTSETSPSSPVTLTMPASEPTADPSVGIKVTPSRGTTSITLSWSPPTGNPNDASISGYEVFWLDANSSCPGQVPSEAQTNGTSYTITGLVSGHMYDLAVASVNAAGGGAWGGAPAAIAGDGAPAAPVISAASSDQLTWPAVPGATGYWIYQANPFTPPNPITWTRLMFEVPQGWNGTLAPGVYTVTAANGTLESPKSNQIALPPGQAATRASLSGTPHPLNPLAWVPAWLRADPNAALIQPNVMTRG